MNLSAFSSEINQLVHSFIGKIGEIEAKNGRESVFKDLLESLYSILLKFEVWPPSLENIYCHLSAAYNYVFATISCSIGRFKEVLMKHDSSQVEDIVVAVLKRVCDFICRGSDTGLQPLQQNISNISINGLLMCIIKALENPIFHFKSLNILGRLLLLVSVYCLHRSLLHEDCPDIISSFNHLAEMTSVPVLKERCHFRQGFLLASLPVENEAALNEEENIISLEDVVCLYLASFKLPSHHLAMTYQPWKWLFTAIQCQKLIQEKSYAVILGRLKEAVKECNEPHLKCRLLCLFAQCYFHLDCPQLAIQTYRDALHLDHSCFSILYFLSQVYRSLNLPDLELESLSLCVMAMADNATEDNEKKIHPVLELDEMIWHVRPIIPPVSFLRSKVAFAQRCFQLKRLSEAAEQYSSLVQILHQDGQFREEHLEQMDIANVSVEAAEVLLFSQKYQECLRLCQNLQPLLFGDIDEDNNDSHVDVTGTRLGFNLSQSTDCFSSGSQLKQRRRKSDFFFMSLNQSQNEDGFDSSFSIPERGGGKGETSRKRLRSRDKVDQSVSGCGIEKCPQSFLLRTRILLCESDALILSDGVSDQSVYPLRQALDILLHHSIGADQKTKAHTRHQDLSLVHSPLCKRQRIGSDTAGDTFPCPAGSSSLVATHSSLENHQSEVYTTLLINTALRMARVGLERNRFSSVLNSCRVIEQLQCENIDGAYLKTKVLYENDSLKLDAARKWLVLRRTIDPSSGKSNLEQVEKDLQNKFCQDTTANNENWWTFSEKDFLELDLACLKLLMEDK